MNFFNINISDSLTDALGWTIIHSLWQGLVIGLIAYMVLRIWKRHNPQFKYMVGLLALVAILVSTIITFLHEYHPEQVISETVGMTTPEGIFKETINITGDETLITSHMSVAAIQQKIPAAFPWITSIWLLGVVILSIRFAGGFILVSRYRRKEISSLPSYLEERFRRLMRRAGITRKINLKLSGKVLVPTVIGVLRPMVLIPAGIISLMPLEQLDSILAHEIAHIRRYDFLINIFQSLMEALFFYHPVVWMLSESVRREREKCCDDFAVSVSGKTSVYARALTGLSEIQLRAASPAVALTGNRNQIIHRVERLIKPKKMKTNASDKIVAGVLILGSAIILTLSTGASLSSMEYQQGASLQIEPAGTDTEQDLAVSSQEESPAGNAMAQDAVETTTTEEPAPAAEPSVADLLAAHVPIHELEELLPVPDTMRDCLRMDIKDNIVTREFINEDGEEQSMKFVIRKGEVQELYVNGEKIPKSGYPEYEKEIERTMRDLKEMNRDLRNARQELADIDWEDIQRDVQAEMEYFRQHEMQKIQDEMKQLQKEQFENQLDQKQLQEEIRKAMEDSRIDQEKMRQEMMKAREDALKAMEEYRKGKYALTEEEFREMEKAMAEAMKQVEAIDQHKLQEILEKELKAIQDIDYEEIQRQIEMAMKEIDFAEIQKNIQESMEHLQKEKFLLNQEMKNIDELIEELEKLELEEE